MRTIETEGILDYKVTWYETGEIMTEKDSKNYRTTVDGVDHLCEPWAGVGVVQNGELVIIENTLKLPADYNEHLNSDLPESQE